MTNTQNTYCKSLGLKATYKPGCVHPHCPICDADLSVQGKHQKVRNGVIVKRHRVNG